MAVCVIGHFARKKNCLNGQTIKTKIITNTLIDIYGNNYVKIIDTHSKYWSLLSLPFKLFFMLFKCENIIIMPGQNGLKYISIIVWLMNFIFRRNIHYCVIGGWLPNFIDKKKWLINRLIRYKGIYVETKQMEDMMIKRGFNNIYLLPNFKSNNIEKFEEKKSISCFNYCTFSRVMREKGIVEAIDSIKYLHDKMNCDCTLDIYGQIDENQVDFFNNLFNNLPDYIRYKGAIQYNESTSTLKGYYALLFPTYYDGEGFAGTIIDALSSGIPIIASNWKYNSELINEKIGILVNPKDVNDLINAINKMNSCSLEEYNAYKKNCLIEAEKYNPTKVIRILTNNF